MTVGVRISKPEKKQESEPPFAVSDKAQSESEAPSGVTKVPKKHSEAAAWARANEKCGFDKLRVLHEEAADDHYAAPKTAALTVAAVLAVLFLTLLIVLIAKKCSASESTLSQRADVYAYSIFEDRGSPFLCAEATQQVQASSFL